MKINGMSDFSYTTATDILAVLAGPDVSGTEAVSVPYTFYDGGSEVTGFRRAVLMLFKDEIVFCADSHHDLLATVMRFLPVEVRASTALAIVEANKGKKIWDLREI